MKKYPVVTAVLILMFVHFDSPLGQLYRTYRPEIRGQEGIVAAGRHFAVEAGMQLSRQGGNAVDVGVAAVFAAAVTEFSHFGFGGEVPILIHDPSSGETVVISGQGPAPKAASREFFLKRGGIPGNGPLGSTVPAVMDALALALERFGSKSLEAVMAPALVLADGFPMYRYLHHYLEQEREASEKYLSSSRTYYPGGRVARVGEMFRQPDLAATFRAIIGAEQKALETGASREVAIRAGRDEFYKGEIARALADAVQKDGGLLTYDDLAGYQGRFEVPVQTTFQGYQIFKAGPWNQGPVLLQVLNLLEGFDLKRMGHASAQYVHTVAEAIKLSYDDRDTYYGDPDFADVPIEGLLSKAYAAKRRELIKARSAFPGHRPGNPFPFDANVDGTAPSGVPDPMMEGSRGSQIGDTTCVNAVDADGMLFSATPSSGWLLDGAYLAGQTGVPMSNRMQAFVLNPESPNLVEGGKRPRTTLTPTIVLQEGKPLLAISTPGGDNQDQQILNVLLALLVFEMGLQEAVEAPRLNSKHIYSSFDTHASEALVLEVEEPMASKVEGVLLDYGHKVRKLPAFGVSTGITAVGVDPKTATLVGAADPRRERYVAGW